LDLNYFSNELLKNANTIASLVDGMSNEEARWRSEPNKWSILEIVNHLHDEELKDFPLRLKYMLYYPEKTWPGIDPISWVIENSYNERDLFDSIKNFLSERENSVIWLKEIVDPNWETEYEASWGKIKAGDMFAAWISHDLLHIRQIVNLKRLFYESKFGKYNSGYAGKW